MDSQEQRIETLSRQVSDLQFGLKILASIFLLIPSAGNIIMAFSIFYFERLFADIFHGEPLPLMTYVVTRSQIFLIILSFCWPLMGMGAALFIKKRLRLSFGLLAFAVTAALLQYAVTAEALQGPLLNIFNSIQDSSSPR